ncbi:MAG: lysophospholipid acyltransferase family protein [Acidobacteria bacterium]|nr:lysophospholipid acyltransferase family protein [Acidobacteriota bacterium]
MAPNQVNETPSSGLQVPLAETGSTRLSRSDAGLRRQVYRFADLSYFSVKQRFLIKTAGLVFYWLITLISCTVRWTVVDWYHYEEIRRTGKRIIFTFWHNCILLATWFWRRRGIVVMSSWSFDGACNARVIHRFGYGTARGSSSRGAGSAMRQMAACLKNTIDIAFTIDGPRGPRFVAKPGAVRLARMTGQAILPFHISAERFWEVNSWDRFQIPFPFTRAVVLLGKPIYVAPDGDDDEIAKRQAELQATLDGLRARGDHWWKT